MCCVQNVLAGGPPSRRRQARRTPLPRAMTTAGSLREQPCDQAGRAHTVASVAQHPLGTPAVTALPAASVGEAGQRANPPPCDPPRSDRSPVHAPTQRDRSGGGAGRWIGWSGRPVSGHHDDRAARRRLSLRSRRQHNCVPDERMPTRRRSLEACYANPPCGGDLDRPVLRFRSCPNLTISWWCPAVRRRGSSAARRPLSTRGPAPDSFAQSLLCRSGPGADRPGSIASSTSFAQTGWPAAEQRRREEASAPADRRCGKPGPSALGGEPQVRVGETSRASARWPARLEDMRRGSFRPASTRRRRSIRR